MSGAAPHPSDDRLIDLAADLLGPEARADLLAHLRGCAPCDARWLETYRGAERIAPRPAAVAPARVAPATRSRWAWIGAPIAAAAVLLAGFVAVPRLLDRGPADGLDYWMPLESEPVLLRSADVSPDASRYRAAIEAYLARDARRVIALLQGQEMSGTYEPLNLLLASALVRERRDAEACDLLGRFDTLTLPEPARDRARFLLYVALRRAGRGDEAEPIARELAAGSGEFAARARTLLAAPRGPEGRR